MFFVKDYYYVVYDYMLLFQIVCGVWLTIIVLYLHAPNIDSKLQ